jgi:hypothetical protein
MNYKRAVGRPKKKPGDVLVEVPCKVPEAVADMIETLVSQRRCGDAKRNQTRFYLLRGLIFCPCGRRRSPDQKSYRCTSRIDAGQHCGSRSTSRRWIEREVWHWFAGFLRDPVRLRELLAHKPTAPASEPARIDELAARIAKLTGQLKRAASAAVRAESDNLAKLYEMESRKIEAERRGLQVEWERLQRASSVGLAVVDDLLRMAERLAENAETLPPDHQRAILQAFGVRIVADGRAWEWEITA